MSKAEISCNFEPTFYEDFAPGDFVLVDSFIDRTTKRHQTFHDQRSANQSSDFGTVCHIAMHPSFCTKTRPVIIEAARDLKIGGNFRDTGWYLLS